MRTIADEKISHVTNDKPGYNTTSSNYKIQGSKKAMEIFKRPAFKLWTNTK